MFFSSQQYIVSRREFGECETIIFISDSYLFNFIFLKHVCVIPQILKNSKRFAFILRNFSQNFLRAGITFESEMFITFLFRDC